MAIIPGWMIALLTFPGVMVHEIAHRLFADLARVPVYDVCYFRIGDPAGYVVHGPVQGLRQSLLISIGPLLINTALCALITFAAAFPLFILDESQPSIVCILLIWVGFSIGMHAFPSNHDIQNFVQAVERVKGGGPLLWIAKIMSGVFWVANALRFVWFDALYAFGICMVLPWMFGFV